MDQHFEIKIYCIESPLKDFFFFLHRAVRMQKSRINQF